METVGKQVQVVSGLGVGGPVGPVGPVGGDLHHHHHPHPHALPPHPHSHPHGHPHGSHGHSLATSNPGRGQPQPPTSHNQHVPARSTPVQLHRPTQNYVNIKSSSPVSPRTIGTGATYVQGGAAASYFNIELNRVARSFSFLC
ncbi:PREDICTED: LIM domain-containing protein A-like [Trachymyrmex cornetzi]|uniref:LIM domain-containing protein A-like n=1 Tax=Trachymyrmex cornetzi TaxID=471704 RepID=UPI00084F0A05|nr:PREDICTED: LIM domain-containing protein A-like [Trachymyrmex cornetzi]